MTALSLQMKQGLDIFEYKSGPILVKPVYSLEDTRRESNSFCSLSSSFSLSLRSCWLVVLSEEMVEVVFVVVVFSADFCSSISEDNFFLMSKSYFFFNCFNLDSEESSSVKGYDVALSLAMNLMVSMLGTTDSSAKRVM